MLLDSAVKANPGATWWIKGDGCDIIPGICESVQMIWSGDVDLNDGKVQEAYHLYRAKLEFISEIGLKGRQAKGTILEDLNKLHQQLLSDKDFAIKGAILYVSFLLCI